MAFGGVGTLVNDCWLKVLYESLHKTHLHCFAIGSVVRYTSENVCELERYLSNYVVNFFSEWVWQAKLVCNKNMREKKSSTSWSSG